MLLVGCASVSVPSAAVDKDVKRAQDAARHTAPFLLNRNGHYRMPTTLP